MTGILAFARRRRWIWPLAGILLLWVVLTAMTARFSLHSLSGVATSAAFLCFPALGQMLVVTTGRGNIDLSIPGTITFCAFLSVITTNGTNAGLLLTLAIVLGTSVVVGLINALLVLKLRIPAMIATLAIGYILATATLLVNARIGVFQRPTALAYLTTARVGGAPIIAIVALAVTIAMSLMLIHTVYGRKLLAVGQSAEAARLSGISPRRVTASAFVSCSVLSGLAGLLLAGYAGGAFLDMGSPFLLQSVGAVVLGGTLISGGNATALGTLLGGMLLIMIVTTMQIAGLPPGAQDILQGVIIILVLALSGDRLKRG